MVSFTVLNEGNRTQSEATEAVSVFPSMQPLVICGNTSSKLNQVMLLAFSVLDLVRG